MGRRWSFSSTSPVPTSRISPGCRTKSGSAERTSYPTAWAEARAGSRISDLLALEDNTGWGGSSGLPRAIIMGGLTQNELHLLMSASRQAGMKPPLWATLTPTSETWTVQDLLKELAAEHQAMQQRKS